MMSDEALRTEFEAARLAGDHDTMARVGPLIWPDDGAPPPAPAPSPAADPPRDAQKLSAAEFARQQREIYLAMEQTHAGSPRMKELEASLEGLFQGQYGEAPAAPAGMTPEAFSLAERVSFPDGTDEAVRDGMLALAWAEDVPVPEIQAAIRDLAQARPMAPPTSGGSWKPSTATGCPPCSRRPMKCMSPCRRRCNRRSRTGISLARRS
jgi:hypothetical protein